MINNIKHFKQGLDFSGLKDGNKLATDIDCLLEFNNKLFIIVEVKHESYTEIPLGQKIALERLAYRRNSDTSNCFVVIATHNILEKYIIDICDTYVESYIHKKGWNKPRKQYKLKEFIDAIKECYL